MDAYLAIKFYDHGDNKEIIEKIIDCLEKSSIKTRVVARDYEKWGKVKFTPEELMKIAFNEIKNSDVLIIEFSEKGVGLGIEAGYAYANDIPIVVIAKDGSDISKTLRGISKRVIFYDNLEDIIEELKMSVQAILRDK